MNLRSLTYTSSARPGLDTADLNQILQSARSLNGLDGITGLLVFNGRTFLQVVEGADDAISDLMARLRRDRRHSDIVIQDDRGVGARSFPDWSMALAEIGSDLCEARDGVDAMLPERTSPAVRAAIRHMVERISA